MNLTDDVVRRVMKHVAVKEEGIRQILELGLGEVTHDLENECNEQASQLKRIRNLLGQYLDDRDPYYALDQILMTMGMHSCSGRTKISK